VVAKGTGTTKTKVKKSVVKKALPVEDEQLRDYEMVLVISPELAEEKFNATLNNISQLITDMGGVVSDVKQWGKRRLAYPIKQFSEGNYVLTQLKLKPTLNREVEAKLQISEEVLRYLLVRLSS
jgi:small subunit ribosomal protein S6